MKKLVCGLLALWLTWAVPAAAETPRKDRIQLRENHPTEYVVVKGDTLWDISGRFLEDPWRWPQVWDVNPQVENPHLIYPGDIIYLRWVNGKPVLSKRPGVVKLGPKVKVRSLEDAIPAIPLADILAFLSQNRIVDESSLQNTPYVVGGRNKRLISGAGDRVYARGETRSDDEVQGIYRPAKEYRDPQSGELLGFEILKIAEGQISSRNGDMLTMDLTKTHEEVRVLDRVLPLEEEAIQSLFRLIPSPEDISGEILAVLGGVANIGQFDAVAVNRGAREGLEPGQVMAIYRKGETLKDPVTGEFITLPAEEAGLMLVFRTYEKVSYGLILSATNVISVGDEVRRPE